MQMWERLKRASPAAVSSPVKDYHRISHELVSARLPNHCCHVQVNSCKIRAMGLDWLFFDNSG